MGLLGLRWSTEVVDGEKEAGLSLGVRQGEEGTRAEMVAQARGLGGSGCCVVERRKI